MKIDTTLAEHAPPQDVSAFLTHASQNGVTLVADGIENAATLELMRNRGCVSGLGFYLGAPLQINRLAELIGS
jgi:EAL domain-containing protein (putative c-di-GMP-specific phosphodiesterase class I)